MMVTFAVRLAPARPRGVARQLADLERLNTSDLGAERDRRRRSSRELKAVLEFVGGRFGGDPRRRAQLHELLVHAGYRFEGAAAVYWGVRALLPIGLGLALFLVVKAAGGDAAKALIAAVWGAALGWVTPAMHVRGRARRRQRELQITLPDALDLLIVCVEAGLALNQALVRVAEEIRHVSRLTSEEL